MTSHSRCRRNSHLWTSPEDRIAASKLKHALPRLGHDQPFEMPSKFLSLNFGGGPVCGEQVEVRSALTRP
jgi:hypothetical protein